MHGKWTGFPATILKRRTTLLRKLARLVLLTALFPVMPAAQTAPQADYTKAAVQGDFVIRDFTFHDGEKLAELRLHYATWGSPKRNAAGEVTNAVLLLHGTLGTGLGWGAAWPDAQVHPLLGPGGALDASEFYVIAPDTIGSGRSSRPSDGLRMKFPHYNLEDIVSSERMLVEHLGVKHLVAVVGASMGGRQAWQWGVQYPDFMDGLVPMISSPFPNSGSRGVIDFLPAAIIKADPAWKQGNYEKNPESARLADITYSLFLHTPAWFRGAVPTRDDAEKLVLEGRGSFQWPDANDFIYMMELNDGFDAWSQLERVRCPVLMINMAGDNMVPVELGDAEKVVARLKNASYLEVKEESQHGHGALRRTADVWGPKLRQWMLALGNRGAR